MCPLAIQYLQVAAKWRSKTGNRPNVSEKNSDCGEKHLHKPNLLAHAIKNQDQESELFYTLHR